MGVQAKGSPRVCQGGPPGSGFTPHVYKSSIDVDTLSEVHFACPLPLQIHTCIQEAPPSSDTFSGSPVT